MLIVGQNMEAMGPRYSQATLPFKAALIQALDTDRKPLHNAWATGFVGTDEKGDCFLYTCWHVVAGCNPRQPKRPPDPPALMQRQHVVYRLLDASEESLDEAGAMSIVSLSGGASETVPLYSRDGTPRWAQDERHVPHIEFNHRGIYVPAEHDVVKIPVGGRHVNPVQSINMAFTANRHVNAGPGEPCVVVGYPYGATFSGSEAPLPVCLTRFIASTRGPDSTSQRLLESIGSPGMSGSPVFVGTKRGYEFFGIYTGAWTPSGLPAEKSSTALGIIEDLREFFADEPTRHFVKTPSVPMERQR